MTVNTDPRHDAPEPPDRMERREPEPSPSAPAASSQREPAPPSSPEVVWPQLATTFFDFEVPASVAAGAPPPPSPAPTPLPPPAPTTKEAPAEEASASTPPARAQGVIPQPPTTFLYHQPPVSRPTPAPMRFPTPSASRAGAGSEMSDRVYGELCRLIHERFGIDLEGRDRKQMVAGRLFPLLQSSGSPDFETFLSLLRSDTSGLWISELANRITTNHTSFFREMPHFDFLMHEALPELERRKREAGSNDLRIWCAACSTGEEPYSIAICLLRYFGADYPNWLAGVLATDISDAALARARLGVYAPAIMRHVTADQRMNFTQLPTGEWQVAESVKREVTFRRFNLMKSVFPFREPFDIIFCRNVMIYFDPPTRDELIRKLYHWTAPGGYLFVGHAESFDRRITPYHYLRPAVYRRGDEPARPSDAAPMG